MHTFQEYSELQTRDNPVYDEAIKFLYATCMDGLNLENSVANFDQINNKSAASRTSKDVALNYKKNPPNDKWNRKPSYRQFGFASDRNEKPSDDTVINLLAGLKSIDGRRQYPSAGGIYSVNIWVAIFPDRLVTSLQSGIYRYNHETSRLDHALDCTHSHFVNSFHPSIEHEHEFSFAMFFTLDLKLALEKYKQRGILFGAMEAGSIYQELIHTSQSLGLRSLVFGGYRLHTLCRTLGINQLYQFPLVMQLFGND